MADLSKFPIALRWPPKHPARIQLYSFPTPNGVKISSVLEELELPYEAHRVDIMTNETWTPDFLSLNPNGKIPAIIDPNGPNGKPIALFESNAILLYLAEKTRKLLPEDPTLKYEAIQWLFFQGAAVGPTFGQLGFFFRFAGKEYEDKRPLERFLSETKRLLAVLDDRLKTGPWIMGSQYTVADISMFGWVRILLGMYGAREIVEFDALANVPAWLDRVLARPAIARGVEIPPSAQ
jgi:GSH-dependent disulfide-bond oxidoreductase